MSEQPIPNAGCPTVGRMFLGIEIPEGVTRSNYISLYLCTMMMGCLMALPAIIQPVFLQEVVGISQHLSGSINAGLQNMGQLSTLLFVGLVGIASDRYGRRLLVVAGFALCFVFYTMFGHSADLAAACGLGSLGGKLAFTYAIRFMIGIGLVLSHPQFVTLVADYTHERGRGKAMALHAIMISLGALAVYGLFTRIALYVGIMGVLYIGGGLGLAGCLVAFSGLADRQARHHRQRANVRTALRAVAGSFPLKVSYVAGFVTRADLAVPSMFLMVWMVNAARSHGFSPVEATARGGVILMTGSLFSLVSFSLVGTLLDRIGRLPVLLVTLFAAGTAYVLIAMTNNPFSNMMYVYICLLSFGKNGAIVATNTLASDMAPKALMGSVLGGLNTAGTLGIILFLQAGGYVFDSVSARSPFILKGAANIACFLWILSIRAGILKVFKGAPQR